MLSSCSSYKITSRSFICVGHSWFQLPVLVDQSDDVGWKSLNYFASAQQYFICSFHYIAYVTREGWSLTLSCRQSLTSPSKRRFWFSHVRFSVVNPKRQWQEDQQAWKNKNDSKSALEGCGYKNTVLSQRKQTNSKHISVMTFLWFGTCVSHFLCLVSRYP